MPDPPPPNGVLMYLNSPLLKMTTHGRKEKQVETTVPFMGIEYGNIIKLQGRTMYIWHFE